MKKMWLILSVFLFISFTTQSLAFAENENSYYAKISSTSTYLCSMPSENSAIFELPYSYFVKVEYVVDDYFKVVYDGIDGYVKKDKVSLMNGTPQSPFAAATFKVFVPYALYSAPNSTSTKLADVDTTATLKFYGNISGEQLNSSTNNWYYCSFQSGKESHFGYIFSGVTDYLTKISTNTETFDVIDEDSLSATEASEFNTLTTGTKVMLIISISVPSLMILYFLIKPSRILQNKAKSKTKKKASKVRHGDYFEFDESEL